MDKNVFNFLNLSTDDKIKFILDTNNTFFQFVITTNNNMADLCFEFKLFEKLSLNEKTKKIRESLLNISKSTEKILLENYYSGVFSCT